MKHIIIFNILKLIYKLFPLKKLQFKINTYNVNCTKNLLQQLTYAQKNNYSLKEIKKIFITSGIDLGIRDNNFYNVLIDIITKNDNNEINKTFINYQVKNLNLSPIKFVSLLKLRNLFYLKSKFTLGAICRKKAISIVSKSNIKFFLSRKVIARSILDQTLSKKEFKDHLNHYPLKNDFKKVFFNKYMTSVHQLKYHSTNYNLTDEEKIYFNFLENKKVAIIGPSNIKQNDGEEIDSFDLAIRFNHIVSNDNLETRTEGSKTDVTYLSGHMSNLLFEKKIKISNKIKFIISKSNNYNDIKRFRKKNPDIIFKKINNYNYFLFYSSLNLLPLTLLDLLETNVKTIKIFNTNLFLYKRDEKYLTNYFHNDLKKKNEQQLRSFLDHDPMQNHELLRKLYQNDRIIGDKIFDKIMKFNTNEYLEELENYYNSND